jgi:capsular exopolysaccharide synthesis family protein
MPSHNEGALGPYLRALRNHRLIVVLATIAALLGSTAWLTLRTPDYEAAAEILVTPLPEGNQTFVGIPFLVSSGDPTRTVQTAATLIESNAAAERTGSALGLSTARVRELVTVEPKGESNVLEVRATAESPELARDMADTFARESLAVRSEQLREQIATTIDRLTATLADTRESGRADAVSELSTQITALENVRDGNDPTLSISELATLPRQPIGAPAWLVLGLSGIAGLMVGLGIALLMEMTERRIRDEEELLSLYPLPVLARVPTLSRREYRRSTKAMPPHLREAFRTLQARLEVRGTGRRTIMVTSASRNDGKTSSATNLALSLVAGGHGVVLIDFDVRKPDVAPRVGLSRPERSLSAMLDPDVRLADLLVSAPRMPLLRVVTAAGTQGDVALLEALLRMMPRVLAEAAELADYVIIDTAPLGEVSDALKIVDLVDDVILVVRPGHTNRVNLEQARDLLESVNREPSGMLLIGERPGGSTGYYGYGDRRTSGLARLTAR